MADPRSFTRDTPEFNPDRGGGLRPAAAPAGFANIPRPADTGMGDALRALGQLEPALDGFISKQEALAAKAETSAGQEAALKEPLEYAAAVRSGKLAPNQSKYFMQGYKHQYGEYLGTKWASEAKIAWSSSEAKNSDDPNASDAFTTKFTADKLAGAAGLDADVRHGLMPHLSNMRSSIAEAQAAWSAHQVAEKNLQLVSTNVANDIDLFTAGKITKEQLLTSVADRDKLGRSMGVDNDSLNHAFVDAFVNKARERNSSALLAVAREIKTIGNAPKYESKFRAASDAILSHAASAASLSWTNQQRAEHVATQDAERKAMTWSIAHPDERIPDDVLRSLVQPGVDPMAMSRVSAAHSQRLTAAATETAKETADAFSYVIDGGIEQSGARLNALMANKQVKSTKLYTELNAVVAHIREHDGLNNKILNKDAEEIMNLGRQDMYGKAALDPRLVGEAKDGYKSTFLRWVVSHPKATDDEAQAASVRIKTDYLDGLVGKDWSKHSPGDAPLPPFSERPVNPYEPAGITKQLIDSHHATVRSTAPGTQGDADSISQGFETPIAPLPLTAEQKARLKALQQRNK